MSYELIFPPDTRHEVRDFLQSRFERNEDRQAAISAIEAEFKKLAVNPALGTVVYGGPFESRRIFRFSISVGDTTRYLQVAYAIRTQTHTLVISGFAPVQF